ncbi:MAG: ATP-binding protein [Candidatus Eisenbacteria bacterium]
MDRDCTQQVVASPGSDSCGERQILALDALSKLTRQFCDKPDFEQLISLILMTMCGQFSVADSFALLRKPGWQIWNNSFFATGKLTGNIRLGSLVLTPDDRERFAGEETVCRVARLASQGESDSIVSLLSESGVSVVCPLVHGDAFFGIVGLGERVTGKGYGEDDLSLLGTIISTITPLVANSYLFWEIAGLNGWYLDILNSVTQGVFVFDRDYKLQKINTAGMDILKTFLQRTSDQQSFVNSPVDTVFPEWVFGELAGQVVQSRGAVKPTTANRVFARAKGTERIYNVSITRTVENGGAKTALIMTLDDVTVQKENEQRLFDLQKLADKGLMASSISHELNNFLTLILGGVELTQMALADGECVKAETMLDRIRGNIVNMERFTAGLTDYTRLDSKRQRGDLNTVIDDVLCFLSVQSRFKRVTITSELDVELPEFDMDTDQIAQVLMNLLNNAADAIKEAGRKDGMISISTAHGEDDITLLISDNGAGMPPEVKEKLFATHFTTKEHGHGYGLVTCATIIESHGGTVTVDSDVGRGTTFTIRFQTATNR